MPQKIDQIHVEGPVQKMLAVPTRVEKKFVFWNKNDFVLFLIKTQKPHSELLLLYHALSPFLELHNNNLLYLSWHSKLRVKKCNYLCFCSVVGQFTPSQWLHLASTLRAKREKPFPQKFCSVMSSLCACPAMRFGMVQHHKQVGCRRISQNMPILRSWRR